MSDPISIRLVDGPLGPATLRPPVGAGAWLVFEGVVRPQEADRELIALVYEAYPPMTERELTKLARQTLKQHGLLAIHVEHSTGSVAVGEVSFRLSVASRHRAEGIAATDAFIRDLKRDVPLWKNADWAQARRQPTP